MTGSHHGDDDLCETWSRRLRLQYRLDGKLHLPRYQLAAPAAQPSLIMRHPTVAAARQSYRSGLSVTHQGRIRADPFPFRRSVPPFFLPLGYPFLPIPLHSITCPDPGPNGSVAARAPFDATPVPSIRSLFFDLCCPE